MQPLRCQQPQNDQRRVNAIVPPDSGVLQRLLQEPRGQEMLKQRQNPWQGGFLNDDDRRERECVSCLKLGYPIYQKT
jgi:hypothetical protein